MWNYTSPESKCKADLAAKEGQTKSWRRGSVYPSRNSGNLAVQTSFHPPPRSHGSSDKTRWQGNRAETRSRGRRPRRNQREIITESPRARSAPVRMRPPVLSRAPHSEQIPAQPSFASYRFYTSSLHHNSEITTAFPPFRLTNERSPIPPLSYPSASAECQMLTHDGGGGEIGDPLSLGQSVQSSAIPKILSCRRQKLPGERTRRCRATKNTREAERESGRAALNL